MLGFCLALLPLLVVLLGIISLRQSGAVMALVGWVVAAALASTYFETPLVVTLGATAFGLVQALGISLAVVLTMLMIFVMKEAGALSTIAAAIKRIAATREEQALFIGMGFGSFVTALGALTPALFPPLLSALGFSPFAAVSIAVLGYDPLTSFALLSLPITIPAGASGHFLGLDNAFTAEQFALKITLYLPAVSVGLAFAMLWVIGGKSAMRRGAVPALLSGLVISLSALCFVYFGIVPVRIVGVISGGLSMITLYLYQRFKRGTETNENTEHKPMQWSALARALSPWILLITCAALVSIPALHQGLNNVLGPLEQIRVFADQRVDLNLPSQMYVWILVALIVSLPVLKPSSAQLRSALRRWSRAIWGPFIAYSIYFSIAYVMFFSAMEVSADGNLVPGVNYDSHNMDVVVGTTLASLLGGGFVFIAASLGLFGAVVGGSETASNMMFMKIQHQASIDLGLSHDQFLAMYGAHATGGGIASAMTPAKLNNAVATIEADRALESRVMRKHVVIALALTVLTGLLTGIIVGLT